MRCEMIPVPNYNFAYCETHDETFKLNEFCSQATQEDINEASDPSGASAFKGDAGITITITELQEDEE